MSKYVLSIIFEVAVNWRVTFGRHSIFETTTRNSPKKTKVVYHADFIKREKFQMLITQN